MIYRIAIDAGHGYNTVGKRTCRFPDGRQMHEHEFNRDVAFILGTRLKTAGYDIVYCFDEIGISDMPLAERYGKANAVKADLFVSVHANA